MQYYIHLPELKLTAKEVLSLRATYYQFESEYGAMYVSETGDYTPLTVVGNFPKSKTMEDIESRLNPNLIDASYFVSNLGINPHTDDNRQCIISFEIQNTEDIPINFHLTDELIRQVHYHDLPIMWNPQITHSAADSQTRRIFFQIELKRDRVYSEYLDLHMRGQLLRGQK